MTSRYWIPDFLPARTIKHLSVLFISTCPTCGVPQSQQRFSCSALQRLLRGGHPIEAYCVACDESWPVNLEERREIAERLTAADWQPFDADSSAVRSPMGAYL